MASGRPFGGRLRTDIIAARAEKPGDRRSAKCQHVDSNAEVAEGTESGTKRFGHRTGWPTEGGRYKTKSTARNGCATKERIKRAVASRSIGINAAADT